ncbi:conserved hypothetical protein [Culex quinquefasciatus]|uniref:Uncharacterized protein n=1 Tax=Culex quinquefasciatus TaxID=7176 RepID=B0WL92_CULQU|nr:conserved hypothetical protein [Culex quinquefasciatus]|eukprot:XP_001849476.1 conserved hypothetical protein [Culex quinquefasciatus]
MTPHPECECGNVETKEKAEKKSNKLTFAAAGGKLKGDVKGPNESDKDDVGRSDADVEDSLNDDLQTKKIVDQTRAVRKSRRRVKCGVRVVSECRECGQHDGKVSIELQEAKAKARHGVNGYQCRQRVFIRASTKCPMAQDRRSVPHLSQTTYSTRAMTGTGSGRALRRLPSRTQPVLLLCSSRYRKCPLQVRTNAMPSNACASSFTKMVSRIFCSSTMELFEQRTHVVKGKEIRLMKFFQRYCWQMFPMVVPLNIRASWKALELAISMTMEKQQEKVTNNQSGGRFDPDFAALFGDVFEVVEKVAGEALKGGSVYTVLTLYVTIRNLLSRSSSWSTANVARFSPAYCWK